MELMICQERVSDSHWITTNTPKGLKDNSGLFQRSVFPTNVAIVALWVTLDVYYKNVLMFQNIMAQVHGSSFQPVISKFQLTQ